MPGDMRTQILYYCVGNHFHVSRKVYWVGWMQVMYQELCLVQIEE